jgi:hypothetical protein
MRTERSESRRAVQREQQRDRAVQSERNRERAARKDADRAERRTVEKDRDRDRAIERRAAEKDGKDRRDRAAQKDRKDGTTRSAQERDRVRDGKDARRRADVRRVAATNEQRRGVRTRLLKRRVAHVPRRRVNFTLTIGTYVPRHFRLYPLYPEIVAYAPIYSGYSYFIVDDTICIVDPETYAIVDVIPANVQEAEGPGLRPALALSDDEMRFVQANVPLDVARTDLRLRLALGAEIPRGTELHPFPEEVLVALPQLESYRYLVVENDIVIVDPAEFAIALVITE